MTRSFIQTTGFLASWKKMGLSDDDLCRLEVEIMKKPDVGKVIPGTGGLRKMRFAFRERGKRGSVRVCYVDFVVSETIYLIAAYPKSKKDNLTKTECKNIKRMIECLEDEVGKVEK